MDELTFSTKVDDTDITIRVTGGYVALAMYERWGDPGSAHAYLTPEQAKDIGERLLAAVRFIAPLPEPPDAR